MSDAFVTGSLPTALGGTGRREIFIKMEEKPQETTRKFVEISFVTLARQLNFTMGMPYEDSYSYLYSDYPAGDQ